MPVVAVVLLDDGCMQCWKHLWNPCLEAGNFDVFTNVGRKVEVLNHGDVCNPRYKTHTCPQRALEVASGLILSKLIWQAALSPITRLALFGTGLHGMLLPVNPPTSRWGRLRYWVASNTLPRRLDMESMSLVTTNWIAIGFVYGSFSPLIWFGIGIALCSHIGVAFAMHHLERYQTEPILTNIPLSNRIDWMPLSCVFMQVAWWLWYDTATKFCTFGMLSIGVLAGCVGCLLFGGVVIVREIRFLRHNLLDEDASEPELS
eukprot:c20631_g3_i3.p1 GENE.c20631_g3_i3~~c20631_g3_i3.p1  ORF type:complete len:260 (+),score=55.68 c20631_g3_i3:1275-2054(+)